MKPDSLNPASLGTTCRNSLPPWQYIAIFENYLIYLKPIQLLIPGHLKHSGIMAHRNLMALGWVDWLHLTRIGFYLNRTLQWAQQDTFSQKNSWILWRMCYDWVYHVNSWVSTYAQCRYSKLATIPPTQHIFTPRGFWPLAMKSRLSPMIRRILGRFSSRMVNGLLNPISRHETDQHDPALRVL